MMAVSTGRRKSSAWEWPAAAGSIAPWIAGERRRRNSVPYWGKIVGTLAGLATRNPWLAVLGLILGHQFDRGFAERFSRLGGFGSADAIENVPEEFVAGLFRVMGFLAKSDGRVTENEIRAARSVMHRLNLGPAQVRHAIHWFEEGKDPGFPLLTTLRRLRREGARSNQARVLFIRLLLEVALSKPTLHQRERAIVWTICSEFDIGRVELAQLEAMLRAQRGFRKSPAGSADSARVDEAYRVLGIDRNSSNAEIKKAYRRLMNKNHPDKIAAGNPDADQIASAERKTREIRGAYEMLKARRSIR